MDLGTRQPQGFTLIEMLIVISLVAILLAIGIPSYQSLRQEQLVKAATQALYTDMMLFKSEAIKRNRPITLKLFNAGTANWCYRIAIDATCGSCADTCSTLEGRKGVDAAEFSGVTLNTTDNYKSGSTASITFSPRSSTFLSGHIKVTNPSGGRRVILSGYGRISTCVEGDSCT